MVAFPSVEFFRELQERMRAESDRFRRLGFIDTTFGLRVLGAPQRSFVLSFEVFECADVREVKDLAGEGYTDYLVMASELFARSIYSNNAPRRGMFVTCLYGVLDTRAHCFTYASAGHCPPATFGPRGARYLPARGKPMGLFDDARFRMSRTDPTTWKAARSHGEAQGIPPDELDFPTGVEPTKS